MTGSRRTAWNPFPRLTTCGSTPMSTRTTRSFVMIDHAVEPRNQVGVPAPGQPALEDRELHPFAESLHQLEHQPPPLRVGGQ